MGKVTTDWMPKGSYKIEPDPEYDFIPPIADTPKTKKGNQCGECGMKFEYGKAYGYCCRNPKCPAGWN